MARTISIGAQGFEGIRENGYFYVDKTAFIREWLGYGDVITLVCRPRRFGKTLNLDTVRCFLSTEFAGRGEELFGDLDVWEGGSPAERGRMRALQGTVPVVALSFADVKAPDYEGMLRGVAETVAAAVRAHASDLDPDGLADADRAWLGRASDDGTDEHTCTRALKRLCALLEARHGKKPVVLLDEYDAPMEVAWTGGYWDRASSLMRQLMNSTFKTNTALGRGLITGVTRTARESIFSDLNNLTVVTTSTPLYQESFGFTQAEVDAALGEYGLAAERQGVRDWYDGFVFGGVPHIYNPWSVTNFLRFGEYQAYWANTSGNGLVSEVVRRGGRRLKSDFEELLRGGTVEKVVDEQVVFSELRTRPDAVWALLLSAGYVKALGRAPMVAAGAPRELALTNREVELSFDRMVEGWFAGAVDSYDDFARALLAGDARTATRCLAEVTRACMSSFDAGTRPSGSQPERFYHGLVLGLLASLRGRYSVESNRESGLGRYDVALVPTDGASGTDPAVVIEFKVFDSEWDGEQTLADTVARAHAQIDERAYVAGLVERGIDPSRIRTYGIAFRGKEVLVG